MRRLAIVFLLGLGCALAAWVWRPVTAPGTPVAAVRPPPAVGVARAEARALPVVSRGIGRVVPANTVQVKSRVDGPIEQVFYQEGDEVHAGDRLLAIDPRPYQAALAQAEGQLARDQAQAQLARADLDRNHQLLDKGFASRQSFDQSQAQAAQLSAALGADQGLVDVARLNLSFTTIRAPIAGRIGKRLVDGGNMVRAGDGIALAEIVQLHPIAVLLTLPQAALAEIRDRQRAGALPVEAWAADESKRLAEGTLVLIGNGIDPATGTIELKASFANADDQLWPGQFVNAHVVTAMRENAVAVPGSAVQPGPEGKFVYVVDSQSVVHVRSVRLGAPADGLAVVEQGLDPGETVVIDHQDQLAPEAKVVVMTPVSAAEPRAS